MPRITVSEETLSKMSKEEIERLEECILLDNGKLVPSPKKLFVSGQEGPMSLKEQVEGIIGSYLFQHELSKQGYETIDEMNDFDIPDEEDTRLDYRGNDVIDMIDENTIPLEEEIPAEQHMVPKAEPESGQITYEEYVKLNEDEKK